MRLFVSFVAAVAACAPQVQAQVMPALPDSTGWGVHVLAVKRDPQNGLWVGTYGQGIFRLPVGDSTSWP